MINFLEIINIQSHEYSLLKFHKGVNIIKGRSHSGKSTIIRTLRWILENKPQGFHFKSHFSKPKDSSEGSIEFDNEDFVSRVRDNKFNGYKLSSVEDPLEALRTDVPDEVKAITQMNNINLQSQGDKYFMLQETPGTVAKELNKIVGLDIIDEVNKKVSRIYSAADTECGSLSMDIKDKKEEIKKYKHLKKAERLINKIDVLIDSVSDFKNDIKTLDLTLAELKETQDEIKDVTEWLTVEKPFKEIKRKSDELFDLTGKSWELNTLIRNYQDKIEEIDLLNKLICLESTLKNAKSILNKLSEMRFKHDKILKLYQDMKNTEKSLKLSSDTLKKRMKEKSELLKSHADEFCSKCGAHQQYWRK